jgi:hypothetical protein
MSVIHWYWTQRFIDRHDWYMNSVLLLVPYQYENGSLLKVVKCGWKQRVQYGNWTTKHNFNKIVSYVIFYALRTVHFGMKLYNDQRNAQVFNVFVSALHVSSFLLAQLQRQVYNFGSGSSPLGMVSAPGRRHHTQGTWTTAEVVHLPLKMGLKKARNMYGRNKQINTLKTCALQLQCQLRTTWPYGAFT